MPKEIEAVWVSENVCRTVDGYVTPLTYPDIYVKFKGKDYFQLIKDEKELLDNQCI